MRKLLAVGNSHLNSLKLSEDAARTRYAVDASFAYSSAEAWNTIPVRVVDGVLQFETDPQQHFAEYSPVPSFVRQLPAGLRLDGFDDVVVGQVGSAPAGVAFFTQNRLPGAVELLQRNPVTLDLFGELCDLANGVMPPTSKLTWTSLPYPGKYAFSLRAFLREVAVYTPKSRRAYICAHPPFLFPNAAAGLIDAHRVAWGEYLLVLKAICSECGFRLVTPPKAARDVTGVFTDLKYSVNCEGRDTHLNADYGVLLWEETLRVLERTDSV